MEGRKLTDPLAWAQETFGGAQLLSAAQVAKEGKRHERNSAGELLVGVVSALWLVEAPGPPAVHRDSRDS